MLEPSLSVAASAVRVLLLGHVQGIGYRPALARLAQSCAVRGWVRNTAAGVEVHVEGTPDSLARFAERCVAACPDHGVVTCQKVRAAAIEQAEEFAILTAPAGQTTGTAVPRDIAACNQCLAEVSDPNNRRQGYLLTTCSSCGPRYSIVERMPYERDDTTLSGFPLCPDCLDEYQSPSDRRFHAQTIACPACGPSLTIPSGALDCLAEGKILAIQGVGGYQLLVDAQNPQAVARLRQRKLRMSKPLAVLAANCESVRGIAELSEEERTLLASPQGPIVVLRLRPGALPAALAPGLQTIGVMLPTSPLHAWLVQAHGRPLVVTSGNIEGQPLAYEPKHAKRELVSVADQFIDHNRPIARPIDDSVACVIAGRNTTLRLARGLAPLPITVTRDLASLKRLPHILALGGHQKAAIALCNGRQAVLGQHIGDLDTLETRARFVEHIHQMLKLYDVRPGVVVHDAHPDYFTTRWAEDYCRRNAARQLAVQHHHAHVAAGIVQQGWLERGTVLGVAWDGTGLGSDGTLWGGEFFTATAARFERTACLRPLRLPGGETAIREPWRIAAAMLRELRAADASMTYRLPLEGIIEPIAEHPQFSPLSTSIGRLFDGVAAIVLPDPEVRTGPIGYEGHFAAMLEDLCHARARGKEEYPFPIQPPSQLRSSHRGEPPQALLRMLDWRPLLGGVLHDLDAGVPRADIAMRFHRTVAGGIKRISDLHPELPIVLGGGVFQNKVLVELVAEELADRSIAFPGSIPVNDGGLAAGQLAVVCALLEQEQCV